MDEKWFKNAGNKGVIKLKNGSVIYTLTDSNNYKRVTGKSLNGLQI